MIKKKRKNIFFIFAVMILLIFFHILGLLNPIEKNITKILNPILSKIYFINSGFRFIYSQDNDEGNLLEKNKILREENNKLIASNAKLEILKGENDLLRESLNFLNKKKFNYILGNIIFYNNSININTKKTITIDKGLTDNIINGLIVIDSQGIVIGKIHKTKNNISEILLTNDSNFKLAVMLLGDNKTSGIVEGELGLSTKMKFISQSKKLEKNQIIITSGLEKNIPKGLVVGKIASINKESNELWQSAIIKPMIDYKILNIATILTP